MDATILVTGPSCIITLPQMFNDVHVLWLLCAQSHPFWVPSCDPPNAIAQKKHGWSTQNQFVVSNGTVDI